ncbi:Coiled-coil_protein [Hexamita inflata]|uniref:Coiled-coil_protein n=1 Tax=Hexamita inflata TaxID=28002 RepID=A0ABP1KRE7_9EUKA
MSAIPDQQKYEFGQKLKSSLLTTLIQAFKGIEQQIKSDIAQRKVHVMFESVLNCNPKTDHLFPKNTLPLFEQFISNRFALLNQTTILMLQKYILQGISEIELKDLTFEAQRNLDDYNFALLEQKTLREQLNALNVQMIEERVSYKKIIEQLKEQIYQIKSGITIYQPDGLGQPNINWHELNLLKTNNNLTEKVQSTRVDVEILKQQLKDIGLELDYKQQKQLQQQLKNQNELNLQNDNQSKDSIFKRNENENTNNTSTPQNKLHPSHSQIIRISESRSNLSSVPIEADYQTKKKLVGNLKVQNAFKITNHFNTNRLPPPSEKGN